RIVGKQAIHSGRLAYAPSGLCGQNEKASGKQRGFRLHTSESAYDTQLHPLIPTHPETCEPCLFCCLGYIMAIVGMRDPSAEQLLLELYLWQTRPEFQYSHQWQPGMVVMWDNRSVLHKANGGYEGYERKLHRTVVA